jgi:penicillin-binding protein 2
MSGQPRASDLSRTRLVVVQVLLVSLMVTLVARLWFLQVVSADSYQAQAADNAVRDVAVQPERGLIVDAMGRPLAANRHSWVLSIDRTLLDELSPRRRSVLLERVADLGDVPVRQVRDRLSLCGSAGAPPPPQCWNGSPYQAVPVAEDVSERVALAVQEQAEDYPALVVERLTLRDYPAPHGVNAAHVLGYLSPVTDDEYARAQEREDATLTASSLVGRSGVERAYDRWLRGTPGTDRLGVDSLGRVLGQEGRRAPRPGDTLVTSIDARVQGVVERELRQTIMRTRQVTDPVTGRPYAASSGASIILDPDNGRVIAMASYPTYNPRAWVGGIKSSTLDYLYDKRAGEPLLSRATQAQLAPGSTFKPFMALGALSNGYSMSSQLDCSSSFTVGNRAYKNFESGAYGYIGIARALQVSCNSFFYRIGYALWLDAGGEDAPLNTQDPLVQAAKGAGFGSVTGIDLPSEATGRIADRRWKMQYWKDNKDYYCKIGEEPGSDYLHVFAREFCIDGYAFQAGDAVNFVIGQGDTIITPMQLAVGYGAIANGGKLYAPRVGKAILSPGGDLIRRIKPVVHDRMPFPKSDIAAIDEALKGTPLDGTLSWKMGGFPLDRVKLRGKTGTAEVYGKQTTSWLATYNDDFVVVQMIEQGGTGSGTSGDSMRRIWEALYGIDGTEVHPKQGLIPGVTPPRALPSVGDDGTIDAPDTAATPARQRQGERRGRRRW